MYFFCIGRKKQVTASRNKDPTQKIKVIPERCKSRYPTIARAIPCLALEVPTPQNGQTH